MTFLVEDGENLSIEQLNEYFLQEVDLEHIRKNVRKLRDLVSLCGTFKQVSEETGDSNLDDFVRVYSEKRGWVCDELSKVDGSLVWTEIDTWNEELVIYPGYQHDIPGRITSWYVTERPYSGESDIVITTELHFYFVDSESNEDIWQPNLYLFELVENEELTEEAIVKALSW